jgi:hypothetical protein
MGINNLRNFLIQDHGSYSEKVLYHSTPMGSTSNCTQYITWYSCKILGSPGGDYEECRILECGATWPL